MSITLDELRAELAPIRAAVDGIPLMNRAVEVLRQEVRALRGAFTAGEISRRFTTT